MERTYFNEALPVWAEGKREEMNFSIALRTVVDGDEPALLRVAGHSDYQIYVNGLFSAQGPARAGHGYFRVDELDLTPLLKPGRNLVCIIAAGYNAKSFYLTCQPPFIYAEIIRDGAALAATGTDEDFEMSAYTYRRQRVQRYSFQRPFTEAYVIDGTFQRLLCDPLFEPEPLRCEVVGTGVFIKRDVPRSDYEERNASAIVSTGSLTGAAESRREYHDRSFDGSDLDRIKGFAPDLLEVSVVNEMYSLEAKTTDDSRRPADETKIGTGEFAVYDMGLDTTGYIRLKLRCEAGTVLTAVFNEISDGGVPDPGRDSCANVVRWELTEAGDFDLISFEPYTYNYIQLAVTGGSALVSRVSQLCEHFPASGLIGTPVCNDEELDLIYDAAVETFRQNATDIFMDCPSRERAGWLCDSFFTARTEYALTGRSVVETAFLDNFVMEPSFPDLPEGMLPMCYPSDHPDGTYIPNWAMWFGVELAEYKNRAPDPELIARAREKMYALAAFLAKYENEYGLLEKLDSWVFVEWSVANEYTQDVNYPTNMLYAKFLDSLAGLYGDEKLAAKAESVRRTIRETAFDGRFFIDNALRDGDGKLVLTDHHTETAQYYAFFSGTATPTTHPELYRTLKTEFGPGRDPDKEYPDVPVSNAFIGNYLRLDMLYKDGEYDRLLGEIKAFFLPMAKTTGTLWENMHPGASCCHGFASYVACVLRQINAARPKKIGKD